MKICIIQPLYAGYVKYFYDKFPNAKAGSYKEQEQILLEDKFAWNGAWEKPMESKGHEVISLYPNMSPLQSAWANENGVDGKISSKEIVARQILAFKPDVVFSTDVSGFGSDFIEAFLKGRNSKMKFCAHICSPFFHLENLHSFDYIFTCLHHQKIFL